jgi:hypothetical protein
MSYCNVGHDTAINKLCKALAECAALKHLVIAIVDLELGNDVGDTSKCILLKHIFNIMHIFKSLCS